LRLKSRLNNFYISDEIINFLSVSVQGNIREIEGLFNSIMCQSQLKNRELTITEVRNLTKNSFKQKRNISSKEVVKIVSDFYNLDEDCIYKKSRRREVVQPRQLIMYILRKDFNISYPTIGEDLGGRDHTTVIHSFEKIKEVLKTNNLLVQDLEQIRSMF
jgi:chromosomal replication initiator protein